MKRFFGYQQRGPVNIFGMPTTIAPEEPEGAASNESMLAGEYVPPEEMTRPTGAYLSDKVTSQVQPQKEQSGIGKALGMISKLGDVLSNVSQNYWMHQGGPKGEAARENRAMDLKTLLASMKGEAKGTNDIQNYQFYASQEKQQGREPMSFYAWKESLNKAGAGRSGEDKDPRMEAIKTAILGKITERLSGDKSIMPAMPGEPNMSVNPPANNIGGFTDLGGGVKIKFGG